MNQQQINLRKKLLALPLELRQNIVSVENAEHIQAIAQKYHLQTEKMQCLAKTAGLVLLGEIPIEQFESEIQKTCGFIPESARDISQDIYQQIFQPIEQFLKQTQKDVRITENPDIKQELAEHGVEIREKKQEDKYREPI